MNICMDTSGGTSRRKVLLSLVAMTFFPLRCFVESKSDVHLDYICAEPVSAPEGESNVPVIMLHGLLDVKETWDGMYQNISKLTRRKVCIYDLRNHGGSSWNDTCTIDSTVEDLETFMDMMKIDRAVLIGHSLGGHTAMKFALSNPSRVEGIFIEDIGPSIDAIAEVGVAYGFRILQRSLSSIPHDADEPTARANVMNYIKKYTGVEALPRFKDYMPLHRLNGEWQWKTNMKALIKALDDIASVYTTMEGRYEGKALFLYGTKSYFRVGDQIQEIKQLFPNAKFVPLVDVNHFIHFVYPDYLKVVLDFLQ